MVKSSIIWNPCPNTGPFFHTQFASVVCASTGCNIHQNYVPRFRVSFNFTLLGAFLAFSSLGAGSSKRTQKPLGAHQERISIAIKENTVFSIVQTEL